MKPDAIAVSRPASPRGAWGGDSRPFSVTADTQIRDGQDPSMQKGGMIHGGKFL